MLLEHSAAPKKSASDVITEALIKAKQDALDALKQTQTEAKSLHDRLLRVSADFENFKKRSRKQAEDASRFANEHILRDLLPILDNFERATEHVKTDKDNALAQGVIMVQQHLVNTLEKTGLTGFSALGESFDPNIHEAVEQELTNDHPPGSVVREYQVGYKLHERLLRPAMVVVAKAKPEEYGDDKAAEAAAVNDAQRPIDPPPASGDAQADATNSGDTNTDDTDDTNS